SGNFNHSGKKFHKTKSQKKACYDRNNARNRDQFIRLKTFGMLDELTDSMIDDISLSLEEKMEIKLFLERNNLDIDDYKFILKNGLEAFNNTKKNTQKSD